MDKNEVIYIIRYTVVWKVEHKLINVDLLILAEDSNQQCLLFLSLI